MRTDSSLSFMNLCHKTCTKLKNWTNHYQKKGLAILSPQKTSMCPSAVWLLLNTVFPRSPQVVSIVHSPLLPNSIYCMNTTVYPFTH